MSSDLCLLSDVQNIGRYSITDCAVYSVQLGISKIPSTVLLLV